MRKLPISLAAAALALALAAPAGAADGTVVASHLNNPRQLEVTPGGVVYVAEAGRGGSKCTTAPDPETGEPATVCFGFTSGVTRVAPGKQSRVVSGLLSIASPAGVAANGLSSLTASPFGGFAGPMQGIGGLPNFNAAASLQEAALVTFNPFNRGGAPRALAALDEFEAANNPAGDQIESDP